MNRLMLLSLTIAAFFTTWTAVAQSDPPVETLEGARETIGKWIATEKLIHQERRDWQQQKEVLEARIDLVDREIADLERKLADARRAAAEAEGKRSQVAGEQESLAADAAYLASLLAELEGAVRKIQKMLPQPVQEKIGPLVGRMPQDPTATRISVAERFQNVLGILNEVNRANSEITLATEIRTLPGAQPSEVKTIYVGLGQAYYLSPKGEAGIGRPTPDGWVWTPANDLAPKILEAVEMLQGKSQPRFVPLPVKIS